MALNDQGQVIGYDASGDAQGQWITESWVWKNGVKTDFKDLIPVIYQKQLKTFYPFFISNRVVAANGQPQPTGKQPVLHIAFRAKTLRDAAANYWEYATFVLRQLADDTWDLRELVGIDTFLLKSINKNGIFSAIGKPDPAAAKNHGLLLSPVEVDDVQYPDKPKFVETLPLQKTGESDNDYLQRQLPDDCIAYIDPHPNGSTSPEMPHLVVKLPGGPQGLTVMKVDYQRLNGWRASYTLKCVHSDEDLVQLPAIPPGQPVAFTEGMDASQEWRVFESQTWQDEIAQRGFFGGTAELFLWIPSQSPTPPTKPIVTFRIGGRNPEPGIAKPFIQGDLCDSRLWFAYAIAKKESAGYGEQDHPYYNQFFGSYRKTAADGKGFDQNKDWQCWAKGWPTYNIDRENGQMTSAGGYGIFQNTGDAKDQWTVIPRRQIWNWQDNVGYQKSNVWQGAMGILKAKIQIVDARYNALQQTYPSCGAIPNYPQNSTSNHKRFSGWDAYTCKAYNGFGGTTPKVKINGFTKPQWSVWHPHESYWEYKDDGYTSAVWSQVED